MMYGWQACGASPTTAVGPAALALRRAAGEERTHMAIYEEFDVAGQTCFVVGGTSGIGRALAGGFAQAGATVIVSSRDPSRVQRAVEELRALGGGACDGIAADVTDE